MKACVKKTAVVLPGPIATPSSSSTTPYVTPEAVGVGATLNDLFVILCQGNEAAQRLTSRV